MEGTDHQSATGSGNGVAAPPILSSGPMGGAPLMSGGLVSGLRPTTAAAVAGGGGAAAGMESDLLLGNGGPDDLDVDYEMRQAGNDRPNTAGAMYGRSGAGAAGQASWGYSRQADPNAGIRSGVTVWLLSLSVPGSLI